MPFDSRFARRYVSVRYGKKLLWALIRSVLIIGISFLILFPLLIKLSDAFKSQQDIVDPTVFFIPKNFTWINFQVAWGSINYPQTALFTAVFSFCIAILQMASCTMVAYAFARFRFWGKKLLFFCVILTLIIPPQVILLPLFLRFRFFSLLNLFQFSGAFSGQSLLNTYWPFAMLSATAVGFKNGLFIYLLRQYFINVPDALEEAANVDGCGPFRTFLRIMLPGAIPMLATVFLFAFVWQWNDFYYSNILAYNLPTLTMKIYGVAQDLGSQMQDQWATALQSPEIILLIMPLVVLYLFTQRLFVQSIEKSGLVG